MSTPQRHTRTYPQAHGGRRSIDNTPRFIWTSCTCPYHERLSAERRVEHLLQCTVKVTNTNMHDALPQACAFGSAGRFLHIDRHPWRLRFAGDTVRCL